MRIHAILALVAMLMGVCAATTTAADTTTRMLTGSNAACGKARVRKSWVALTSDEKQSYKDAVSMAMANKQFFEFAKIHMDMMSEMQAHSTCAFILWHKRFLLAYENMLRSQAPQFACVTVPYWDASQEYASLVDGKCKNLYECSALLRELGGAVDKRTPTRTMTVGADRVTGTCYTSFAGQSYCDDRKTCGCVPRDDLTKVQYPSGCGYSQIFNQIGFSKSFKEFTQSIQTGAHNELHGHVGGFMATYASPVDPIFWSWHAAIDLFLYLYHQCHVSGTATDDEVIKSVYGFDQDASTCRYESGAPEATLNSAFVQKISNVDAAKNPLIGKYFDGLSGNIADYINYRGEGDFGYTYEVPAEFTTQLLQSPEYCLVYAQEWSASLAMSSSSGATEVEAPAITTEAPTVVATTEAPTASATTEAPVVATTTEAPVAATTEAPPATTTSAPTTAAPVVAATTEEPTTVAPGTVAPRPVTTTTTAAPVAETSTGTVKPSDGSVLGAVAGIVTPAPTSGLRGAENGQSNAPVPAAPTTKAVATSKPKATKKPKVITSGKADLGSAYWTWFIESRKNLAHVLPGNVSEIAKQLDYHGCISFKLQFGLKTFSEKFKADFKLKESRPACLIKVEDVDKGKVDVYLDTKGFKAASVSIKPGVKPQPPVNPVAAYKSFMGMQPDENEALASGTANRSSGASSSLTISCTLAMTAIVALSVLFV